MPFGHPDFGKAFTCPTSPISKTTAVVGSLNETSNLVVLSHMTFDTFMPTRLGITQEKQKNFTARTIWLSNLPRSHAVGFCSKVALARAKRIFAGVVLPKGDRSVEHWINTAAGFNRDPQEQPYLNLRTFPLRLSGVRGDGRATWDFSLLKKFRVREPLVVEFRADVYNAWNHPNFFSQPDTSPNSSTFGQVFGAEPARNWQFGLNVQF